MSSRPVSPQRLGSPEPARLKQAPANKAQAASQSFCRTEKHHIIPISSYKKHEKWLESIGFSKSWRDQLGENGNLYVMKKADHGYTQAHRDYNHALNSELEDIQKDAIRKSWSPEEQRYKVLKFHKMLRQGFDQKLITFKKGASVDLLKVASFLAQNNANPLLESPLFNDALQLPGGTYTDSLEIKGLVAEGEMNVLLPNLNAEGAKAAYDPAMIALEMAMFVVANDGKKDPSLDMKAMPDNGTSFFPFDKWIEVECTHPNTVSAEAMLALDLALKQITHGSIAFYQMFDGIDREHLNTIKDLYNSPIDTFKRIYDKNCESFQDLSDRLIREQAALLYSRRKISFFKYAAKFTSEIFFHRHDSIKKGWFEASNSFCTKHYPVICSQTGKDVSFFSDFRVITHDGGEAVANDCTTENLKDIHSIFKEHYTQELMGCQHTACLFSLQKQLFKEGKIFIPNDIEASDLCTPQTPKTLPAIFIKNRDISSFCGGTGINKMKLSTNDYSFEDLKRILPDQDPLNITGQVTVSGQVKDLDATSNVLLDCLWTQKTRQNRESKFVAEYSELNKAIFYNKN